MPELTIKTRRANETESAFPELDKQEVQNGSIYGVSVLEKGMTSGRTSVGIIVETASGEKILVQTSALLIDALSKAITGAEFYWTANPL